MIFLFALTSLLASLVALATAARAIGLREPEARAPIARFVERRLVRYRKQSSERLPPTTRPVGRESAPRAAADPAATGRLRLLAA